jgi:hypothetical protein
MAARWWPSRSEEATLVAQGRAAAWQGPGVPQAGFEDGVRLPRLLPMLAVPATPFDAPDYSFEVKWDRNSG